MATRIVDLGPVVGPPGADGAPGTPGAAGAAGMSAYQYAVAGGYTGTEAQFKAKLAKEYLPLTGGDMTGIIDMSNHFLTGLPDPVAPSDAVNYQTLIKVIAMIPPTATVTVTGKDQNNNTVEKHGKIEIETVGTYGNDTILSLSGTVPDINTVIKTVTDVIIELPVQFQLPSYDWSNLPGYDMLRIANYSTNGLILSPFSYGDRIKYRINSSNFNWASVQEVKIQGHVKVGVKA